MSNDAALVYLDKARQAIHEAQVLLADDSVPGALSRTYYASLHASVAALVAVDEAPKTHTGVHRRFWVRFVETGQFPRHLGGILSYAREMREQADYEAFTQFDTAAAADLLRDVEAFVAAAESLVQDLTHRG